MSKQYKTKEQKSTVLSFLMLNFIDLILNYALLELLIFIDYNLYCLIQNLKSKKT